MSCGRSRRLFGAYWDDELTQAEREWLEAHFAACTGCRSEYESLVHTLEMVGSLPRIEPAPNLAERALARARRAAPVSDRLPSGTLARLVPVTAVAALLAVLVSLVVQWTGVTERILARGSGGVAEPVLVAGGTNAPQDLHPGPPVEGAPLAVAEPDSLFDPSQDIEFILDPVTLRKGRAHTVSRLAPEKARGDHAVISF